MKKDNSSPQAKFRWQLADVVSFGRFHHQRQYLGLPLLGFAGGKEFTQARWTIAIGPFQ